MRVLHMRLFQAAGFVLCFGLGGASATSVRSVPWWESCPEWMHRGSPAAAESAQEARNDLQVRAIIEKPIEAGRSG